MKKIINELLEVCCEVLYDLWYFVLAAPGRSKRFFWNRGIKLFWYRLWIRKNEFDHSLDLDVDAIRGMNEGQLRRYVEDLIRRRMVAHKRDLEREDQKVINNNDLRNH